MKNALGWLVTSLVSVTLITAPALGRAGGGRSFGRSFGRGSSGSSGFGMRQRPPANPYPLAQPQQDYRAPATPAPSSIPNYRSEPPAAAPSRGGFLRNMAGGIAGGFLGSMLFNSVGRAMGGGYGAGPVDGGYGASGGYGGGRGGIGLFELMVIAGLGYLGYRLFRSRQGSQAATPSGTGSMISFRMPPSEAAGAGKSAADPLESETASDIFFRVQGAWTRRDLGSIQDLLGDEVRHALQTDLNELRRQKQINRLENISVREVDVGETWRDGDTDVATVRFHANLLDYTVDEASHQVLAGSDLVPVKFVEDWTFARTGRGGAWQVVGISQAQ